MNGFSFSTNTVFKLDDNTYRIDRLPADDQVVLENLRDGHMSISTRAELLKAYSEGRISVATEVPKNDEKSHFGRPLQDLPARVIKEIERRRNYIHAFTDMGGAAFTEESLGPIIQQVAKQISDPKPPSAITLYRWVRKYRSSKDLRELIPRDDMKGSSLLRQSDRVLDLAAEAVNNAFQASPAATVKDIHVRLVGKIKTENLHRLPTEQLKAPSLRTMFRMLKRVEAYDLTVLKEGKVVADNRFRIVKAGPKVAHILERVEVDHTPLDLFLIDEKSGLPHGRPILTMYIDWYSRFPLGYYLSFGGASATAVLGALRHAILPKEPALEVVPGLHIEHQWPCYGRMDALILDNGLEFHGFDLESIAFDLDIRLQYCPKRQPRFKGVIERYLKTVNYFFTHQIPGTSLAALAKRGDYDPQKHAILTMAEFKQIFEKWILDIYSQTLHRGIGTTPWAKWQDGAKRRTLELPPNIQQLKQRIGLVRERRLGREGITLDSIRYAGDELSPIIKLWGAGVKVRVVFDSEDLGSIQVWAPEQQNPVTVLALDQAYAKGLTLVQHELIKKQVQENGKSAENSEALAEAKYQLAISLDDLSKSRKQRTRRRAANIHGITSNNPEARLDAASLPKTRRQAKPNLPTVGSDDDVPPTSLPAFRLNKREE